MVTEKKYLDKTGLQYTLEGLKTKLNGKSDTNHTHKYAGSSTAGGSATSAVRLDTSAAGSATQPVYFMDGKPVATTYTLGKSVPADAVFTDTNTHYASKNVVGLSTATSNTASALTNGNVYINSVENGAVTSAHKISGTGTTTVTTDANGNILINSTAHPTSLKNPNAITISLNGTSQGGYDGSEAKNINITPANIGAYTKAEVDTAVGKKANASHTHTASDITSVNASAITGVIAAANLPSFVDDVLEGYLSSGKFYKSYDSSTKTYSDEYTGETGKIYVDLSNNKTYRWSGSAYTVISETLALGETSSTAYRGDYGKVAYDHAAAHGSAFASGLYKIQTNSAGHVTGATAVAKTDITALGIPAQDTVYTHPTTSGNKHIPSGGASGNVLVWASDGTATWGVAADTKYAAGSGLSLNGTVFSNSGVRSVATGTANGTIAVDTNGTTKDVAVKGLGSAAYTNSSAYEAAGTCLPLSGGTLTGDLKFNSASNSISWPNGTVQQRVSVNDDNESGTSVYLFQQSEDTGTTWKDLFEIKDTGEVVASKFTGQLNGNASTASKLGTSTVGGTAKPVYLNAGVATACSATVGSASTPVYMSAGTVTACGSSLGVSITGNAATATKATQDSAGQQINTTYVKSVSASGNTVTVTKGDGTTSTFVTQDTTYTAITNDEIDEIFTAVFG